MSGFFFILHNSFSEGPPKLEGALSVNTNLMNAKRLFEGQLFGAESFASDKDGVIYTGTNDGKIWRINGERAEILVRTGIDDEKCGTYKLAITSKKSKVNPLCLLNYPHKPPDYRRTNNFLELVIAILCTKSQGNRSIGSAMRR